MIAVPESFMNHQHVVEFVSKMWIEADVRDGLGYMRRRIEATVPDLRTAEELAAADDCRVDGCDGKVFLDTRYGLCRLHQYGASERFVTSGLAVD